MPPAVSTRPSLRDIVTPRKVVTSLLLAGAALLIVIAFTSSRQDDGLTATGGIENVAPRPGQLALRQDRILADLTDGLTGVLVIDGREIPEDQLLRQPELGIVSYTPGPGTETGALSPGSHTASVLFWDPAQGRGPNPRSYRWSFQVH